ncbi:MAG TPA: hypothetical protein VHV83_18665, partial [Armatimonadota bacterium]|nr:hypothetical protein [Armatimonadota bacterium]
MRTFAGGKRHFRKVETPHHFGTELSIKGNPAIFPAVLQRVKAMLTLGKIDNNSIGENTILFTVSMDVPL